MKTWSFRLVDSGEFTGATFTGAADVMRANIPPGCEAVEGLHPAAPDPAADRRIARHRILRQIEAQEAKQLRAMRELTLDANNAAARARLAEIDAAVATLRERLRTAVE